MTNKPRYITFTLQQKNNTRIIMFSKSIIFAVASIACLFRISCIQFQQSSKQLKYYHLWIKTTKPNIKIMMTHSSSEKTQNLNSTFVCYTDSSCQKVYDCLEKAGNCLNQVFSTFLTVYLLCTLGTFSVPPCYKFS